MNSTKRNINKTGGLSRGRNIPFRYTGRDTNMHRNRVAVNHLEKYAAQGNRFIHEVAYELGGGDFNRALRITRAVLHAVRDRLPANDAVEFGQGLPMMIKALYFDRYDLSVSPVRIRSVDEFLDYIRQKDKMTLWRDFPSRSNVIKCLQAVFFVLENRMDYGQVRQIKKLLPKEISELINAYPDLSTV